MLPISLNDRLNLIFLSCGVILESEDTEQENDKDSTRFVRSKDVDRSPLLSAMKNAGHNVTSLAKACDVEPSMISRLLREPINNDPDESARNPSIGLAARISKELNTSPEALFPDIFDVTRNSLKAKKSKRNL